MARVPARAWSDDRVVEVSFDARPWLENAGAEEIVGLAASGWGRSPEADEVVRGTHRSRKVRRLLDYLALKPRMAGEAVGFECEVQTEAALSWLRVHRPEVYGVLVREGLA